MAQRALEAAADRTRDLLGLGRVAQAANALTSAQRSIALRYYGAALRRTEVARTLREAHNAVVALRLYRETFQLMVAAIAVARAAAADPDTVAGPAAFTTLTELARAGHIPPLPPPVERAAQRLSEAGLLAWDDESADALLRERDEAATALDWLRRLVEPRTPRRIRVDRLLWLGGIGLAVVALLALMIVPMLRPPNIALHCPVTISARHPSSKAPADNSGLVNGVIEPTYGIHTGVKDPWVMVALEGTHAIAKVKVYNRGDGWFDDGLPMTLELTEDGKTFTEVDRRAKPFTASSPWVFDASGRRASAVRIRSRTYVALTEVEVYEKR